MAKYHVNPKTGNVGQCRAKHKCKFGGDSFHHETKDSAEKAYETTRETFENDGHTKNSSFKNVMAVIPKHENNNDRMQFVDNCQKIMRDAPDSSVLVLGNGNEWTKNTLYSDNSWKFTKGKPTSFKTSDGKTSHDGFEKNRTYDGGYLNNVIARYGARIVKN